MGLIKRDKKSVNQLCDNPDVYFIIHVNSCNKMHERFSNNIHLKLINIFYLFIWNNTLLLQKFTVSEGCLFSDPK